MAQFNSGEWMEASAPMAKEHPGFESPRMIRKKRVSTPSAPSKLATRFAALDMESEEEEEEPIKHVEPRNLGPTWAQVAKGVAKTEEDEDEDEELPPLNWGQRPMARWGDVSA
jgi:hypothetical protein